jgi:uncharacterized tellurite resistance protein B-like protein
MGLLSRLTGKVTPPKTAEDDALLVHCMLLMCGADGSFDPEEIQTVQAYFAQVPELKGKNFDTVYQAAVKILRRYPNLNDSVKALASLTTPALKQKAFLLAVDIAMSSGDVDDSEDRMLEAMQRVLELRDDFCQKVIEVLSIKYTKAG